jgi:hypothetical protein
MASTFKLINTYNPSGVANLNITGIPSTYSDLYLTCKVQNTVSNSYSLDIRLVGSTSGGNVYHMRSVQRYNGSARVAQTINQAAMFAPSPFENYANRGSGIIELYVPDYSTSDSVRRNLMSYVNYGNTNLTSGANDWIWDYSWKASEIASPINEIRLSVGSGSINGQVKIYGILRG